MRAKPHSPRLRADHPLAPWLLEGWLLAEAAGNPVGLVRGLGLSPDSGGFARVAGPEGPALRTAGAGAGAYVTLPTWLRPDAATIVWRGRFLGTPGGSSILAGLSNNDSDSPPYDSIRWFCDSTPNVHLALAASGGTADRNPGVLAETTTHTLVATFDGETLSYYRDGVLLDAVSRSGTISYGATALWSFGDTPGINRDTNADHDLGLIFGRALTAGEVADLTADPYALARPRRFALFDLSAPSGATGSAALDGTGTLAATGQALAIGAATLSADGGLAATGGAVAFGAAGLSASGTLDASGLAAAFGSAALDATGTLDASGSATTPGSGSAALSATGTLTASGVASAFGSAALSADGSVVVSGAALAYGAAGLSAEGVLVATGSASGPAGAVGSAAFSATGTLAASGIAGAFGSASLSAVGSLAVRVSQDIPSGVAGRVTITLDRPPSVGLRLEPPPVVSIRLS